MPGKNRSNPYHGLSRKSLYKAAETRIVELMKPTMRRTPEERAELALDTAYLLIVLSRFVDSKEYVGDFSPQKSIRTGDGFAASFARYYEQMCKSARYVVYTEAGDLALGDDKVRTHADLEEVRELYHAAMESYEGLTSALEKLQEMHHRTKK